MYDCSICFNDGIVIATPIEGDAVGLTYAFRCACSVGQAKPQKAIPVFTGRVLERYRVLEVRKAETPARPAAPEPEPADSLWEF